MRSASAILGMSLSVLVLAGCASSTAPQRSVEEARAQVRAAAGDPLVQRYARTELEHAQDAFAQAELGWRRGDGSRSIERWASMAEARAAAAREAAKLRRAEEVRREAEAREVVVESRVAPAPAAGTADATAPAFASTPRNVVVTFGDDLFLTDRVDLDPRAAPMIDRVAGLLREDPRRTARIEGHTDAMESRSRSLELSGRRADAVRGALVERGIEQNRLSVRALGDSYPVASNETPLGRERNRRVDVVIAGPPAAESQRSAAPQR